MVVTTTIVMERVTAMTQAAKWAGCNDDKTDWIGQVEEVSKWAGCNDDNNNDDDTDWIGRVEDGRLEQVLGDHHPIGRGHICHLDFILFIWFWTNFTFFEMTQFDNFLSYLLDSSL